MPENDMPGEIWLPKQSPKGFEVFNAYDRMTLVVGPRKSGKSFAVCHRVWRHLWETPNAHVGIFSKTVKSAKDGGSWSDLVDVVGPEWINSRMIGPESNMPIAYTTADGGGIPGPRQDGQTRTMYFAIRNMWGGESIARLFSLDNDNEVEAKMKQIRFSMIWFVELSNFQSREVFNISVLGLRQYGLTYDQQMWIADTNPAKEGKDSWIYKLWYIEKFQENHKDPDFQNGLRKIEFTLDDNPFLDPRERRELEGVYANDPGEYERHVLGKWTRGKGGIEKHFSDLIIPDVHYIPDAIDVEKSTNQLISGWDIGSSVNHAAVLLEERIHKGTSHFMVLDECESIGERISTEEFAYMVYQKMLALEQFYKKEFLWEHWSDSTAVDTYRSAIDGFDATLVMRATNGRVELQGADKPEGSIRHSIRVIRKLLREHRLFVGENCPQVKRMLEEIEQPNNTAELTVDPHHPLKHIFDAFRYPIYMRLRQEIIGAGPNSVKRSSLISI